MKKFLIYFVIFVLVTLVVWVAMGIYFGTHPWPEDFCEGAPDLFSWQYWKEYLSVLPITFLLTLFPFCIVSAIIEAYKLTRKKDEE